MKKTKKHIHNWQFDKIDWCLPDGHNQVDYAYFYCHCGKSKKVMVVEEVNKK